MKKILAILIAVLGTTPVTQASLIETKDQATVVAVGSERHISSWQLNHMLT